MPEKLNIDTQHPLYYEWYKIKRKRAEYFFKDEKGIQAYKILKRFSKWKDPLTDYDGCHITDISPVGILSREEWEQCVKVYNNKLARTKRLKRRLKEFDGYLYFVTLTFTDEQLKMTSDSRRHNLINPLLKRLKDEFGLLSYVGVKEYGKRTEREHYHFVIAFRDKLSGSIAISTKYKKPREFLKDSCIEKLWNAIVNVMPINSNDFIDSTSNYLSKVAGYLDKDTNKTQHLIYSSEFKPGIKLPSLKTDENGFIDLTDEDMELMDMIFAV